MEEVLLLNKFFFRLSISALVAKIWPDKLCDGAQMAKFLAIFLVLHFQRAASTTFSDLHSKFALGQDHV